MTKRVCSIVSIVLTSLITLLGFGSCKTTKKMTAENPELVPMSKADSIYQGLIPPPDQVIKPIEPTPVLYGAPPVRIEKVPEKPKVILHK